MSKLKVTQGSEDFLLHRKTNDINNSCHVPVNRTVLISLCQIHTRTVIKDETLTVTLIPTLRPTLTLA